MTTVAQKMAISFGEFYQSFGLSSYPFSVYTSESELDLGKDLFIDTSMYSPVIEGFNNGRPMLLAGDRGTGKTAIIYDFTRKSDNSALIVNITDFSQLPVEFTAAQFYKFVIVNFAERLFVQMTEDRKKGNKLSKADRVLLSYFLAHFVKSSTRNELRRKVEEIQSGWLIWLFRKAYGVFRFPLNVGANATATFLGDLISQGIGTPKQEARWAEYFPELAAGVDETFSDPDASFRMLKRLAGLAKKVGYKRVTLIFDKIDEDARLNNAAEDIASFVDALVTDNKFLLDEDFQVVVSLWVIPFNMLKDRVRTQKLYCPSVTWGVPDLIAAADRRVQVYSNGAVSRISDLFVNGSQTQGLGELMQLANKNPRDLWHLYDKSFRAHILDPASSKISSEAIKQGIDDFVCHFNFYEYYPRRSNARANSMDVYAYIRHLLKLESPEFTRNQLNDKAGTGSSTQNYVTAMENIGLVERSGSAGGSATFKIRDPKVVHALSHSLDISRSNS